MADDVINNYSNLNNAIDVEAAKFRAHNRLLYSNVFLNICMGIGGLIILLAIAWYIYNAAINQTDFSLNLTNRSTPEENLQIRSDLQQLIARDEVKPETPEADVLLPPEKQYTAFSTEFTSAGEQISTGRTFRAGVWEKPSNQFCYLMTADTTGQGNYIRTDLETLDGEGKRTYKTKDDTLIALARLYCRFE
jgi:hypothetical protein